MHISENQGIYKISSPSGRVYVGQSVDLRARFAKYRLLHCDGQKRLYNSFIKYGVDQHSFEIIEYCSSSEMNIKERAYQDQYDVLGKRGLNCKLTPTDRQKGRHSEETKRKIAQSHIGKKHSPETILALKKAKQNISEATKEKLRKYNLGKKMSEATKEKQRRRMMGNKYTIGVTPVNAKKVKCQNTGNVFNKIGDAADYLGLKTSTLAAKLRGQSPNDTTFKYA